MTKVYIVAGDDDSGATIFGMYPTEQQAQERTKSLEELYEQGEDGHQYMYYTAVELGPNGSDLRLSIGN